MSHSPDFSDALQRYVNRATYSAGQLARLTGIPKPTILSWLDGRVKHPRSYSDLIKLAEPLQLASDETTQLLASAGFPEVAAKIQQLDQNSAAVSSKSADTSAPFQAIPALPYFVGRQSLMKQIEEILLSAPVLHACCLEGMAGTGKTALAAKIAYQLRPHFPDGVLWANLHCSRPMTILSAFARAFGEDVDAYTDLASRSQVVRQLLADKRVLLVLDNVWHGQDIAPLLPPSTGETAVIITTRRHDLFATIGMQRLTVGPFDQPQQVSLQLFQHFLGPTFTAAHEKPLSQIADLLGHLPLAVAIAASRLAFEPSWAPEDFRERLQKTHQQLSELVYEDKSVQVSFSTSFALLDSDVQHFFSLLGLFGGHEFTPAAAAAVAQTSPREAEDNLRKLYALSLCQPARMDTAQTRYRLHPLLSQYAEETAVAQELLPEAHLRFINYYVNYGEEHRDNKRLLSLEYSHISAVLALAQRYGLQDAYQRCTVAFAPILDA